MKHYYYVLTWSRTERVLPSILSQWGFPFLSSFLCTLVAEPYLPPSLARQLYSALKFETIPNLQPGISIHQNILSSTDSPIGSNPSNIQTIAEPTPQQRAPTEPSSTNSASNDRSLHADLYSSADVSRPSEEFVPQNLNQRLTTSLAAGSSRVQNQDSFDLLMEAEKWNAFCQSNQPELPARYMLDVIEDYLVSQSGSGDSLGITRVQLEPLTDLLRK